MTSEPDDKPGRRPPTIELKAAEIAPPADAAHDGTSTRPPDERAAPNEDSAPHMERRSGGRFGSHLIGAAVGAIIVAAIGTGVWLAGLLPPRESAVTSNVAPNSAPTAAATTAPGTAAKALPAAASSAETDAISARLDKIERTIEAQRPEPVLGNRLAAVEAQTKALADQIAALDHRVDDIAGTSQSAAKQADAATATAEAAKSADQNNAQRGDIDALNSRTAALESTVKTLADKTARDASSADDRAARLTIAAAALRAAVERGVPYQAELATVQSLGVDHDATAPLEPFASSGVLGTSALGHELAELTPALQHATEPTPGDQSFLGRLKSNAKRLVRITPVDAPPGNDPSAVVTRIAIDAAHGDIGAALAAIAALPPAAKPLVADWVAKAQAREAAVAASRRIAADALAALNKPAAP